jgi:Flp pilus assembly protein TadD
VQQNPNNVEAHLGLAIAYRRAGRDADALPVYQRVITLDPNNRLALTTLGLLRRISAPVAAHRHSGSHPALAARAKFP